MLIKVFPLQMTDTETCQGYVNHFIQQTHHTDVVLDGLLIVLLFCDFHKVMPKECSMHLMIHVLHFREFLCPRSDLFQLTSNYECLRLIIL